MTFRPVSELPKKKIQAVFTDLDDTLTLDGAIDAPTYDALCRLKAAGFWVAIVSGRPAGWADALMRLWPLDAMVFENGAGIFVRGPEKSELVNLASEVPVSVQKAKLQAIFDGLKRKIPHLKLASDQPYRLFDFAIDFTEDPPRLTKQELELVLAELARFPEITFKLSSIHVNYWYGTHTKVTACEYLLNGPLKARGIGKENVVYCGDSPNDEPLFEYFPECMGVQNLMRFADRMKTLPKYLSKKPNGSGFQEIASHLLSR